MAKLIITEPGNSNDNSTQESPNISTGGSDSNSNSGNTPIITFHPVNESGLIRGEERSQSNDQNIALVVKNIIEKYNTLNNTENSVTIKDVSSIKQLIDKTSGTNVDKQKKQLIKQLQKNQSKCNHSYSKSTNRCIYCTKHKDSHVYDTKKIIL
jgi:hypothetical protein